MARRVASTYKTLSTNAILVVAGVLPLHLMISERNVIHLSKKTGTIPPTREEMIADSLNKWQSEWQNSDTGGWTKRLIPDLRPWVSGSLDNRSCRSLYPKTPAKRQQMPGTLVEQRYRQNT